MTALAIAIAGGLGCLTRFIIEYLVRRHHPAVRPWGTVGANGLGCFLAGFIAYRWTAASDAHLQAVALTGFCGGITTFSSAFAIPALLARPQHTRTAIAIVVTTPLVCVACFALGMALAG